MVSSKECRAVLYGYGAGRQRAEKLGKVRQERECIQQEKMKAADVLVY
mgnify:CR=1 FL=1